MYVKWNNTTSAGFKVSNGVRQGGILSPYLFCVYMDDLSHTLNMVPTGCTVGAGNINHFVYSDDLALLSPTANGMRALLETCEQYGIDHDIKFNSLKSCILIFKCKLLKDFICSVFYLNGVQIPVQNSVKYLGHIINDELKDDLDILRAR